MEPGCKIFFVGCTLVWFDMNQSLLRAQIPDLSQSDRSVYVEMRKELKPKAAGNNNGKHLHL